MPNKFTPGPWYPTSAGIICKDIGDTQHNIATCADWSEETEANARLIAASPRMALALQRAAHILAELDNVMHTPQLSALRSEIVATIKEATPEYYGG